MLVEGHSSIDNEQAVIRDAPFACTWLTTREDRTARLRLIANREYWDAARGPHVAEVIFRNDLTPARALELVCTTEGEVDLVTDVDPAAADRVESSPHAKLVTIDAMRAVVGVINRDARGLPLGDQRARLALNLAVDRKRIVREGMYGRATPLAGLTPPSAVTFLHRLSPYAHDPEHAAQLWRAAGGTPNRPLHLAAPHELGRVAPVVADDVRAALGMEVETTVYANAQERDVLRQLAEKSAPPWDILLYTWGGQTTDGPPLELHRAFVGADGAWRAGSVIPAFEELFAELTRQTSPVRQAQLSYRIDKFVYEEALAVFLCAPRALYAVNKQVDFTAYKTTFELAECRVSADHWSRRGT